jgi:hypothetical protein
MEMMLIDGKWSTVYPTEFVVKYYNKQITGGDNDHITVEYNNGEFSLFGEVSDFKNIIETILKTVQKNGVK